MTKFVPASFNAANVIAGLHKAMGFGEATRSGDVATFYIETLPTTSSPVDAEGLPFDPAVVRAVITTHLTVPCALEYVDHTEQAEPFGTIQPSRLKLILLDADYQRIKGFRYVAAGGDKYYYISTEPPVALGSIDVWTLHCNALDEK